MESVNKKEINISPNQWLMIGFAVVIFFGTILLWGKRLWAAYFQGVTPRTAGFITIDIGAMMTASQFFIVFLMVYRCFLRGDRWGDCKNRLSARYAMQKRKC